MTERPLLSVMDAARRLGVDAGQVALLAYRGELEYVRVSEDEGAIQFSADAVEACRSRLAETSG